MAIIVLVIVAVMSALIFGFSSQTIKTTSNIYLREQAQILALSSTEYALLALSGHDHSQNCLQQVNIDANGTESNLCYEVNMSLSYIVDSSLANAWRNAIPPTCPEFKILGDNLQYADSNLTIIIDTVVHCVNAGEHIRFHRRSIQKP